MHPGDLGREALRQRSAPATDLEHDVARVQAGLADDRVEQVGVGEEVLAQAPLPGARARHAPQSKVALGYQPKTRAAFASTVRSSSS